MRTTIRIRDDLLAAAKELAARTGRTLTQVIEDALREILARRPLRAGSSRRMRLPTYKGRGLRAGVDLDSAAALADVMDEDAAP